MNKKKVGSIIALVIGSAVYIIIVVAVILNFFGKKPAQKYSSPSSTATVQEATETQELQKKEYALGETYNSNGIKMTFTGFDLYQSELDENKNKNMLNVHFKLENGSKEDITFSVLDFSCFVNNKSTDIPLEFNDDHIKGFEKVPAGRYTERGIVIEASKNDRVEIEYEGQIFVIN